MATIAVNQMGAARPANARVLVWDSVVMIHFHPQRVHVAIAMVRTSR
jgi:hypothetical protein